MRGRKKGETKPNQQKEGKKKRTEQGGAQDELSGGKLYKSKLGKINATMRSQR